MQDPIDVILQHEGGFVNHKADRGGPTNLGITQATLSKWLGRKASIEEVRNLTREEAREIYETNYLTGPRIHLLPESIRTQVLDMSVNHGPKNAIRMLQRVLNAAGFGPVDVDGVLGPQSRNAAERAAARMGSVLPNALVEERVRFFEAIVARDASQKVFLKGWVSRARSFTVSA